MRTSQKEGLILPLSYSSPINPFSLSYSKELWKGKDAFLPDKSLNSNLGLRAWNLAFKRSWEIYVLSIWPYILIPWSFMPLS